MNLSYNFRLGPEAFWLIGNTIIGAVLTTLLTTDLTSITDWQAWGIGFGVAIFRTAVGSILAAASGGGFQAPGVPKEEPVGPPSKPLSVILLQNPALITSTIEDPYQSRVLLSFIRINMTDRHRLYYLKNREAVTARQRARYADNKPAITAARAVYQRRYWHRVGYLKRLNRIVDKQLERFHETNIPNH